MRFGEFMPYLHLFVWADRGVYAYNEYMLIAGMLIMGVNCSGEIGQIAARHYNWVCLYDD